MGKNQGGSSRRRTRLRRDRNQLTASAARRNNPVEVAFARARRAIRNRNS